MVYWNFFLVDGVAAIVAVVDDNVIKASSFYSLHCMRSIPCYRTSNASLLFANTNTRTHTCKQTRLPRASRKRKSWSTNINWRIWIKNKNPFWELKNLVCFAILWAKRVRYGMECVCRIRFSLENMVFLWFADGTQCTSCWCWWWCCCCCVVHINFP